MLVSAVGVVLALGTGSGAATATGATAASTGGGVDGGMGGQSPSNTALNMIDPPFKI